ncbi:hypothetical protein ANCCEY_04966 [Ancylostoma ceylanicum]|uniref:SXP/RAL-2 family protein Ani s 5-like cation-binding domain-containing protein n=1 Tax=Ancylostoma ceylanicum TaxID=53326 RepID=A0A0D6LXM2_9BILA|nr:hypothetical protein ANCCEY_04966 [Ancylostoma ceylanicum]
MKTLLLLTTLTCTTQPWHIFDDPHMSRGQREKALDNWADQYGLTDAYNRYKNATAAAKGERRKAILKALEDLPKFFNDLEKIETGQNYTYEQERDAVQELRSTLDARDRRVMRRYNSHYYEPDTIE